MDSRFTKRGGFTLLEMLVVMGLVAVMLSWLASATMNAREMATRTVCISNLRQLVQACKMYEADNEHLPINYGNYPPHGPAGHWQNQIWPYIRDQRIYICPSDPDAGRKGGTVHTEGGWPYSYVYLLNNFWLNPDNSYRPPTPRSPLFMDEFHQTKDGRSGVIKPGGVIIIGHYDGSVEAAPPSKYPVLNYEPEDGRGMLQ